MPRIYEPKGILRKRKKRPFVKEVIKEVRLGDDLFDALFVQKIKEVKQKVVREKKTLKTDKIKISARAYNENTCRPLRSPNLTDSFDALLKGSFFQVPKQESTIDPVSESSKSENAVKKKGKYFKRNSRNNSSKPKMNDSYLKLIEDSHVEFFKQENSGKDFKKSELISGKYAELQRNSPNIIEKWQNVYLEENSTFTHKSLSPLEKSQCGEVANLGIESSTPITQQKNVHRITCHLSPIVPMFGDYRNKCEQKENSFSTNCNKDLHSICLSNEDECQLICELPISHSVSEHSTKVSRTCIGKCDEKSCHHSSNQRKVLATMNVCCRSDKFSSVCEHSTQVEVNSSDKTCSDKCDKKSYHHSASQSTVLTAVNICSSIDPFASQDNEHKFNNSLSDECNASVSNKSVIPPVEKTTSSISNSLLCKENCISGTVEASGNYNSCGDECDGQTLGRTSDTTASMSVICNNFNKFASSVILEEYLTNDDVHTLNNSLCNESNPSVFKISAEAEGKASYVANISTCKVTCRRVGYKKRSTHIRKLSHHTNGRRSPVDSSIMRSISLRTGSRKSHAVIPLESLWSQDHVPTGFRDAYVGSTSTLLHSSSTNRLLENTLLDKTEISFKDIVLQRCGQTELLNFADVFSDSFHGGCKKIGEGVYGEVFSCKHPGKNSTVLKIMPIEGDCQINGEQQKSYKEVLSEIVITMELSNLRKNDSFHTSNFPELIRCWCVQGLYPPKLLVLWHEYKEEKTSENDSPEILPEDQIYIILELANVGSAMENYTFCSAKQSLSAFMQVTHTLAVAEFCLEFEHRDLHWGNILIKPTKQKKIDYKIYGEDMEVESCGIQASIIDFTLSRMTYEGCCIFNNLADDPALFEGKGDYQFDIYRHMKEHTENNWHVFQPYNNVLWLSYILQKLISEVYYRNKSSKAHNNAMTRLKELRDEILNFRTAWEVSKLFL